MSSVVTGIMAAGINWTIDYNAGEACDVVITVFTCIKIAYPEFPFESEAKDDNLIGVHQTKTIKN